MATACDTPSPELAPKTPRSRLVVMSNPPSQLSRPSLTLSQTHTPESPSPRIASPPLPVRSPLRPAARSISSQSASGPAKTRLNRAYSLDTPSTSELDDFAAIVKTAIPLSFQMRDQHNFPAMEELLDALNSDDSFMSKSLPLRPDSPLSLSLLDDENDISYVAPSTQPQTPMTKRHHALHELLSSERAYASDLALIREVHLPLALGMFFYLRIVSLLTGSLARPNCASSQPSSITSKLFRVFFTDTLHRIRYVYCVIGPSHDARRRKDNIQQYC